MREWNTPDVDVVDIDATADRPNRCEFNTNGLGIAANLNLPECPWIVVGNGNGKASITYCTLGKTCDGSQFNGGIVDPS